MIVDLLGEIMQIVISPDKQASQNTRGDIMLEYLIGIIIVVANIGIHIVLYYYVSNEYKNKAR